MSPSANLLPPPLLSNLSPTLLPGNPDYQAYTQQITALSLIPGLSLKLLPPSVLESPSATGVGWWEDEEALIRFVSRSSPSLWVSSLATRLMILLLPRIPQRHLSLPDPVPRLLWLPSHRLWSLANSSRLRSRIYLRRLLSQEGLALPRPQSLQVYQAGCGQRRRDHGSQCSAALRARGCSLITGAFLFSSLSSRFCFVSPPSFRITPRYVYSPSHKSITIPSFARYLHNCSVCSTLSRTT